MCGRYGLIDYKTVQAATARLFGVEWEDLAPRYNIAPSQTNPLVAPDDGGRARAARMRWGLVPFWDKSEQPKFAPINARSEEAPAKPMFREAIRRRRALAPADVFYEWQRVSEDRKIPHAIGLRDGEPFFLAAIYEPAAPGRPETYALLTTGPNELMQGIHARMPVILTAETAPRWLGAVPLSAGEYAELCTPFPSGRMRAYPVSSAVNSPRNDSPACLVPAASPGPIAVDGDLFS